MTPPRRQRFLRNEYKKLIKVVDNNRKLMEKGLPKDVGPIGYAVVSNAPSTLATIMESTVRVLYFEVELLKIDGLASASSHPLARALAGVTRKRKRAADPRGSPWRGSLRTRRTGAIRRRN